MAKKKNIIIVCALFSFLHGQKEVPLSTVKHEGLVLSLPIIAQKQLKTFVTSDYNSVHHQEFVPYTTRDVIFQDDLLDLITLDETCKQHLERFKQLSIIIQAVNEYHCPRGQQVQVTIKNDKWVIVIKDITEDLLLECIPLDDLLPEKRFKNPLERYLSAATQWITKMGIYIWGKTLAKYAKCTVIINGNIHPDEEHILCSDIIIDLFDLAEANKLNITREAQDLLNTHIIISEK